jgi:hypothetical protein
MDTQTTTSSADVARTLGEQQAPPPWKKLLKWAAIAALVLIALYWFANRNQSGATTYVTQDVTRGKSSSPSLRPAISNRAIRSTSAASCQARCARSMSM